MKPRALVRPVHNGCSSPARPAFGLPIGVYFLGRFGDEATLLRLAAQLEAAQPWAGRWPALHAAGPAVIR